MIISRTPYRVSFFGGGTDYPQWYLNEGGATLSTTIDKYCYISCRYLPPYFIEYKHRIVWSHIETVNSIAEILHPAVRAGLTYMGYDDSVGVELHHQGDLPARSGIGSSSSFTVGLINALTALRGEELCKHDLILKAIDLEQNILKESVGSQDQVAAGYGGFNVNYFHTDGTIKVKPVEISPERLNELQSHLMLFYTGTSRMGGQIAQQVIENLPNLEKQLREMRSMVDQAEAILYGAGDLNEFGRLLHEGWLRKRELHSTITNSNIDNLYETALQRGALGGKLLGAGGRGFMVFYVPPERQPAVREALTTCLPIPFNFEDQGSAIIYNEPDREPHLTPAFRS